MRQRVGGIALVGLLLMALGARAAADTLFFDFSSLDHDYWKIVNDDGHWTIGTTVDEKLLIERPASSTPANRVGGISSNFYLIGDFNVYVDYEIANLPKPDAGQTANEAKLHAGWPQGTIGFLTQRTHASDDSETDNAWYYDNSSGQAGSRDVKGTNHGRLRIERVGNTFRGYSWDVNASVWKYLGSWDFPGEVDANTKVYISLEGYNNNSDDPIEIYFDNLYIEADTIAPAPPAAILFLVGAGGILLWRRRRESSDE